MTEQERIHKACGLGMHHTLPFICVATGAQPSVVVKEVLDRNWLGVCRGINAIVAVSRTFHNNNYISAIGHIMGFYDMLVKTEEEDDQYDIVDEHLEWFLTQYAGDLLLGGAESKRYNGWGKLDKYEELAIRTSLGPNYPKRVVGLDSKLKIMYARR